MATSQAVIDVIKWVMPGFRNNHDKVVFAVHAVFLTSGFDLTATGRPAFADYALASPSQDLVGIDGWNEFDKDYAFVYMNEKTSKKFIVKCLAMEDYLLVDALADGGKDAPHLEIEVGNYTTESSNVRELFKNLDKLVSDLNSEILYKLDATLKHVSSSVVYPPTHVVNDDPHNWSPFGSDSSESMFEGNNLEEELGLGRLPDLNLLPRLPDLNLF